MSAAQTAERLLSSEEAVDYLASRGVQTSRRMLDRLRAEGTLPWVRVALAAWGLQVCNTRVRRRRPCAAS